MKPFRVLGAACALILFSPELAVPQAVNATLLGTVTDPSGAVIPSAKIILTDTDTGTSRVDNTNGSGNYTFPDIAPGNYAVAIEAPGFKRDVHQNIAVTVNTSTRVDVQLQPGDVSSTVEVTAAPPPLQTDRADVSSQISTAQTANLPVGTNRNFQGLLNLVPGTTRATFQHSTFFNAQASLQTEVNGQLRMANNYQIEGIDDNERTGLLQYLVPPIEAIQTVDVTTSNFEAELGRAAGAVTNVILKSGTNSIHGAAYEFFQNTALNARNFFDARVSAIRYNYFGGNVGGPIVKDKLFYFGDFLRIEDHESQSNTVTIPTPAEISGNLSASPNPLYNPFTGNPDGTGRQQFPGNIIQPQQINPISAKLLTLLPTPNVASANGANNYFALLPFQKNTTSFDVKVDYIPSEKDRLSVRLSYQRPQTYQAPLFGATAGGPGAGGFQGSGLQRSWSGGINYDRVFSPTLVAEFRAGVGYYHNDATPADYGTASSSALGIPGVNLNQLTSGVIGVNFNSFFTQPTIGYSASTPWDRAEANIDFVNTWSKSLGNHTFKWGGDLRLIRDALLQGQTFSPRGLYTFSEGQTALRTANGSESKTSYYNDLASFLIDAPSTAGRDLFTIFPSIRGWQFFAFGQDKWVVTPKLTVDLGLRWEFYPPYTPQFPGGLSNYNPQNNTLVVAGISHNPSDLGMITRYKYFAPRAGLAYRLRESTVLRAGFGISYTPFPDNNYAYNYPVRQNVSYNPLVASYGPASIAPGVIATWQNGFPAPSLPPVPADGIITNPAASTNYFTVNTNFKNPYVESWNLSIQQALPFKFTLDTAYVGNHGVDASLVNYNLNAAVVAGLGNLGLPEYGTFKRTATTSLLFVPYSNSYNSLQIKLNRQFQKGLLITTSYTYGKGMGFQTGDDGGLDFYINQRRNYARNDFDRTHTFVQSYVYELPFGPGKQWLSSGWKSNVLGNWRVNGILTAMSGLPVTIGASSGNLNAPGNTQTADQVAPLKILKDVGTDGPWFSTASFAQPSANGVFGSSGRNAFSGPGYFNLDLSLFKIFTYRERINLEIRGESFGVTNTAHFTLTQNNLTNGANFGHVTSTLSGDGGGRTMQLGVKLTF